MLDLFEAQSHKWEPDIGNNRSLPEGERAWVKVHEITPAEVLALDALQSSSDIEQARDMLAFVKRAIVEVHGFVNRGEPVTDPTQFADMIGMRLWLDLLAFLKNPVPQGELKN